MEANRLKLLVKLIDVALVIIVVTLVYNVMTTLPYHTKFSEFAENLPSSSGFDPLRRYFSAVTLFALVKMVVFRGFFGIVLFQIRKVVKSILNDGVFLERQAKMIRRLAISFLIIASVLFFLNFLFMLAAFNKGHERLVLGAVDQFFGILENYVVTALIAFGIAEIFNSGTKLKEEQELTI